MAEKKSYSGKFVVRISPAAHKVLAAYCFNSGKSLNSIAKEALEEKAKKISGKSVA